jgi:hypothetical protein
MKITNNTMQLASQDPRQGRLVAMPQVSFSPPAPTDNATTGVYKVIGVSDTAGATIRYTLDGSRPAESSALLDPEAGISLPWPGRALVVNMRAFKPGLVPSVTNGAVMELNYVLGREAPHHVGGLSGKADHVEVTAAVSAPFRSLVWRLMTEIPLCHGCSCQEMLRVETAHQGAVMVGGWVVDSLLPMEGVAPVTITVSVDDAAVVSHNGYQ